jgi:hypothetical protein
MAKSKKPAGKGNRGGQHEAPRVSEEGLFGDEKLAAMLADKTLVVPEADPLLSRPGGLGARLAALAGKAQARPPHVVVVARAGTGKTFTLIVGTVYMFKDVIPEAWAQLVARLGWEPVPSPQQAAVWEQMRAGAAGVRTVRFGAFNNTIVNEFEHKWGWVIPMLRSHGVELDFKTMHGTGFQAVRGAFEFRLNVDKYRWERIACEAGGFRDKHAARERYPALLPALDQLVRHCKLSLLEPTQENLDELVSHYGIGFDPDEKDLPPWKRGKSQPSGKAEETRRVAYDLVPKVLAKCLDVRHDRAIDFNDQVWLPHALGLEVPRFDLFLGDEVQDWNAAQQEIALKAGRRLVLCGDPYQAIYGFTGAGLHVIQDMTARLAGTAEGVEELPLTVTRRCGKAVVAEARKLVPDFEAHESNPEGVVRTATFPRERVTGGVTPDAAGLGYVAELRDADMLLCRCNAPLVSQCFLLLKLGRKANIVGRDVGQGLVSVVTKLKASTVAEVIEKVEAWHDAEARKELARKCPNEGKLITLEDRRDCVLAFTADLLPDDPVQKVIDKIESVFADKRCPLCRRGYPGNVKVCDQPHCNGAALEFPPGVRLSSVHKAKGLEADRVFILLPAKAGMPHPMAKSAWEQEQEKNLLYVARTRAITELVYVTEAAGRGRKGGGRE